MNHLDQHPDQDLGRPDHPHSAFAGSDPPDPRVVNLSDGDANARVTVRAMEARETEIVTRLGYAEPYAPSA